MRAPNPAPMGPVGSDVGFGSFMAGVGFIFVGFLLWPAATMIYDLVLTLAFGGAVAPVLPSLAAVLSLVGYAALAGLSSALLRLRLRRNSLYLTDLVEAALGAASGGQITVMAVALNLAIGAGMGAALAMAGVSSPLDALLHAEPILTAGGAIALALAGGGGDGPADLWDALLMLLMLFLLLGALIGCLAAALFAWIGAALGARAGQGGSSLGAALVLSLTRCGRVRRNSYWRAPEPLPRAVGDPMDELARFEAAAWRRPPRRDLLENYRSWLTLRGLAFDVETFIARLPAHRDWLREHGDTLGQRYLGAFSDWLEAVIEARRREERLRERYPPEPLLSYTDGAPQIGAADAPLTYPGWRASAAWTGVLAGAGVGLLSYLPVAALLTARWS